MKGLELCKRFYAEDGRPRLPAGRYLRLLLIGYLEALDAERAIAWRAADSFALREFLGLELSEVTPDHSTISPHASLDGSRGRIGDRTQPHHPHKVRKSSAEKADSKADGT
jgi:Transposase domain (DUF772)